MRSEINLAGSCSRTPDRLYTPPLEGMKLHVQYKVFGTERLRLVILLYGLMVLLTICL